MELLLSLDLWVKTVEKMGLDAFKSPKKGILDVVAKRVGQLISTFRRVPQLRL